MERGMKSVILHDSRTGNGRKIADTIAGVFREKGIDVRVVHYSEIQADELAAYAPDLLVVGTAVRAFSLSAKSKQWLRAFGRALGAQGTSVAYATAYMTHALPVEKAGSWGRRFQRRLARIPGIKNVDPEWHSGRVVAQAGPLEEGTVERFRDLAERLVVIVSEG